MAIEKNTLDPRFWLQLEPEALRSPSNRKIKPSNGGSTIIRSNVQLWECVKKMIPSPLRLIVRTWFHRPLEKGRFRSWKKITIFRCELFVSGRVTLVDLTYFYVDFHQSLVVTPPLFLFKACGICVSLSARWIATWKSRRPHPNSTGDVDLFGCPMKTFSTQRFLGWMSIAHFPETFANMLGCGIAFARIQQSFFGAISILACCWPWQIPLPSMAAKMRPHREAWMSGMFFFFFSPYESICFGLFGENQLRFFGGLWRQNAKKWWNTVKPQQKGMDPLFANWSF